MLDLPEEIIQALESGEVTERQLVELISLEAQAIGMKFKDALECARTRTLPPGVIGNDLEFLIKMLPQAI